MADIKIDRSDVNFDLLAEEMKSALGDKIDGISGTGNGQIIVHMTKAATPADAQLARTTIAAHDMGKLSKRQSASAAMHTAALPIVGTQPSALTAEQQTTLLTLLLWNAGALDENGAIRDLDRWVRFK